MTCRSRPFGRGVWRLRQNGRWPVRTGSPPGGGGGFEAGTPMPPASDRTCRAWRRVFRLSPAPAAGRRGLSRWPPSTLAQPPHQVSEGTRRRARAGGKRVNPFNPPDQQEKCLARAPSVTRKHRSAPPPALRWAPMPAGTGGAVEARVASREIKAPLSGKRPSLPPWRRRRSLTWEKNPFSRAPGPARLQRLRWLIATLPRIRPQAMPIGQVSASPSRPQAQATAASGTR